MKFHWMKIISLAAIAMVRGQNNEISFFDERERERGGGRRDCPTFVENICRAIADLKNHAENLTSFKIQNLVFHTLFFYLHSCVYILISTIYYVDFM